MQTHLKEVDLKKKHKDLVERYDERRKEYEALAASIKTKSMYNQQICIPYELL